MERSIQQELDSKSRRIEDLLVELDVEERNAHRESKKRHRDFELLKEVIVGVTFDFFSLFKNE
jgi:hypothetical protein